MTASSMFSATLANLWQYSSACSWEPKWEELWNPDQQSSRIGTLFAKVLQISTSGCQFAGRRLENFDWLSYDGKGLFAWECRRADTDDLGGRWYGRASFASTETGTSWLINLFKSCLKRTLRTSKTLSWLTFMMIMDRITRLVLFSSWWLLKACSWEACLSLSECRNLLILFLFSHSQQSHLAVGFGGGLAAFAPCISWTQWFV